MKNQARLLLKKSTALLVAVLMLTSVFTFSFVTNAFAEGTQPGTYEVTTANENGNLIIRKEASASAPDLGVIPNHTPIIVDAVVNGFGHTEYNNIKGYVSMQYLRMINNTTSYKTGTYVVATKDDPLNLRANPDVKDPKIGTIPKGATIVITEVNGVWGKTTYGYNTCTHKRHLHRYNRFYRPQHERRSQHQRSDHRIYPEGHRYNHHTG